jgi:putative ABC transport system substrate-binding protein
MNAVSIDAALFAYQKRIIAELGRVRLPSFAGISTFAEEGALIAFSADWMEMCRHAGGYAGKVLRGVKPADLPVEQPTKFVFIINLKTAKALGLTIPQSVLLRADEVIQ